MHDRIIVTGTLPGACYAGGMTSFLFSRGIRIFDYPRFAEPHEAVNCGHLRVPVMLKREGWKVGQKRVCRLCRLEGLQLRMKVRWR